MRGTLDNGLKVIGKRAMGISGGKSSQAEGAAGAKP